MNNSIFSAMINTLKREFKTFPFFHSFQAQNVLVLFQTSLFYLNISNCSLSESAAIAMKRFIYLLRCWTARNIPKIHRSFRKYNTFTLFYIVILFQTF